MSKPKVFISHSAKTRQLQDYLRALTKHLEEEGFLPFIDWQMERGTNWETTIDKMMDHCDVAIVLISETVFNSKYVLYEVTNLMQRFRNDPFFLLLPVHIAPVKFDTIASSTLDVTKIVKVQPLFSNGLFSEDKDKFVSDLDEIKELLSHTERQSQEIASVLSDLSDYELQEAGMQLRLENIQTFSRQRKLISVSRKLAKLGFQQKSIPILADLGSDLEAKNLLKLLELVSMTWAHLERARRISGAVRVFKQVALNATKMETARLHVKRACYCDKGRDLAKKKWEFFHADGVVPEDDDYAEPLAELVLNELCGRLNFDRSKYLDDLEFYQKQLKRPIFFGLPPEILNSPETVLKLKERFPGITFFLLTDDTIPQDDTLKQAGAIFLHPELKLGDEDSFWGSYKTGQRLMIK